MLQILQREVAGSGLHVFAVLFRRQEEGLAAKRQEIAVVLAVGDQDAAPHRVRTQKLPHGRRLAHAPQRRRPPHGGTDAQRPRAAHRGEQRGDEEPEAIGRHHHRSRRPHLQCPQKRCVGMIAGERRAIPPPQPGRPRQQRGQQHHPHPVAVRPSGIAPGQQPPGFRQLQQGQHGPRHQPRTQRAQVQARRIAQQQRAVEIHHRDGVRRPVPSLSLQQGLVGGAEALGGAVHQPASRLRNWLVPPASTPMTLRRTPSRSTATAVAA